MISKKPLFNIALMLSAVNLHGMQEVPQGMEVQTLTGAVILPQSVIEDTPFIKEIQDAKELQGFRMRGLFGDQPKSIIQWFVQDSEALKGRRSEVAKVYGYRGIETAPLSIAFARRIGRFDLVKAYIRAIQGSRK